MNEEEVFIKVVDVFTDNNLRLGSDYIIKQYHHGCFSIKLCPKRYAILDIHYFYSMIPDIKVFKIKQRKDVVEIALKVKIRGC